MILFTSDHACHFRTRNAEYKRSCHDASIRVPTAFCGLNFEGGQAREMVSLVDLSPCLLGGASICHPKSNDGPLALLMEAGSV
ncbi:MAG: hypothetical protein KY445_08710 [Armatimonadetes bacterium]|nr:hypothetical protein [Armatimonadota bacterium]